MEKEAVELTHAFVSRGDLAHLALFIWAIWLKLFLILALRELAASAQRFNTLVAEILRIAETLRRN